MANPNGKPASDDVARQHAIEELGREAHELYDISRSWAVHARLEGKIGNTWEDFGERVAAERARLNEATDLDNANGEGERVYELLVLMRVLRDAQSGAGVAKLNAAAPQLRTTLSAMTIAIQDSVAENNDTRQHLERLYHRLAEQLERSVNDRETAVALLDNLEIYLQGVQRLAHTHAGVRDVWLKQADILAAIL